MPKHRWPKRVRERSEVKWLGTVYALDLPGMGWSDIVFDAKYKEPEL